MKIALRPFERNDFEYLMGWIPSPEFLFQWSATQFTFPLDQSQLEMYYQSGQGEKPQRRIFTGVDAETGQPVGHIELGALDEFNRSARLCRVLIGNPAARGQGAGTQLVTEALKIGFHQMRLHRIELYVFESNLAAKRCYERLGFITEGVVREGRRLGNDFQNMILMSLLEREWPG